MRLRTVLCLMSLMLAWFFVFGVSVSSSQTFPSTPILDDFNRPNEGSPGGPNWVASVSSSIPAHVGISVNNNQAVGQTTTMSYSSVWTQWFSEDQEVYFTYTATPGTHACMGPSVRVKTPTDLNSTQYLLFICQDTIGQNRSTANIWRRANNAWTLLKQSTINADIKAGDQVGLRAIGSTIKAYLNGAMVSSVVDGSPVLGGGYLQLYVGDDVGHKADNFGGGVVSSNPPPEGGTPEITSPVPGSVLSGSSATFSWESNGESVLDWWLHVGNSQGTFTIEDTGSLGAGTLSKTITGLPTNGGSVWVRLWYRISSGWEFVDAQYTASGSGGGGGGNAPALSSPTPGSVLPGSTATFSWLGNGTNVLDWWVHVGTTQGAFNIKDTGSLGSGTLSTTVSGLPTNGSPVWVRLWYSIPSGWQFVDAQYTASGGGGGGGGPAMIGPTPGSVLSGSSVTFSWAANGQSVRDWWLHVGTSQGSFNLKDTGSLGAGTLSTTISGLPTNGSAVWVRLWYSTSSGWQFVDVQYTASGG